MESTYVKLLEGKGAFSFNYFNVVYLTWNGKRVTSPLLLYEEEIVLVDGNLTSTRGLVCRSEDGTIPRWHDPRGDVVLASITPSDRSRFYQLIGYATTRLIFNDVGTYQPPGLFHCQHVDLLQRVAVGVYPRLAYNGIASLILAAYIMTPYSRTFNWLLGYLNLKVTHVVRSI